MNDQRVRQMGVEVPGEMQHVVHGDKVLFEQRAELLDGKVLADALLTVETDGDPRLAAWVLDDIGHPLDQVVEMLRVAVADVIAEMGQIERAVAGRIRLDRPTAP
jgi:hypothetical protein